MRTYWRSIMLPVCTTPERKAKEKLISNLFERLSRKPKSFYFGISPLALAACGGGGSGSTSSTESVTSQANAADNFNFTQQFKSSVGTEVPDYKVFTEGSLDVAFSNEAYSLKLVRSTGDYNNDGYDDVLVGYGDTMVEPIVLISDGNGKFTNSMPIQGDGDPRTIRNASTIDIDNDGDLDIVAFTAPHGMKRSILGDEWDGTENDIIFYNENGEYFNAVPIAIETYNHGGAVGDLNGDGICDITSISEWPLGTTPESPETEYRGILNPDAAGNYIRTSNLLPDIFDGLVIPDVRIGDINGDGIDDIVIATSPSYKNVNTPAEATAVGSFKVGISNGTLNLDQYDWTTYGTHPMSQDDWDTFSATFDEDAGTELYDGVEAMAGVSNIELIDLNDDGQLDIIVGHYVQKYSSWIISDFTVFINENGIMVDRTTELFPDQSSNESFTEPTSSMWSIFEADINVDGLDDIVIQVKSMDTRSQFDGLKSHTFYINEGTHYAPVSRANLPDGFKKGLNEVRPLDLNGDNSIDLISLYDDAVITHLNNEFIA